jgi:hypothetical protein
MAATVVSFGPIRARSGRTPSVVKGGRDLRVHPRFGRGSWRPVLAGMIEMSHESLLKTTDHDFPNRFVVRDSCPRSSGVELTGAPSWTEPVTRSNWSTICTGGVVYVSPFFYLVDPVGVS